MTLPRKASKRSAVNLSELVWFLYGPPGIGKSTLASGFHNARGEPPLFLWTSPVTFLDNVYKQPIENWKHFRQHVRDLQKLGGARYGAIVVDIIDLLWMQCREHVLHDRGIEHESDLSHGKGFDMVKRQFIPEIAKLVTCGYSVVFVSHAQVRDTSQGRAIRAEKIVPTLQGSAKSVILPICVVEAYLGFSPQDIEEDSGTRRAFFKPTGAIEAKDWTGTLPSSFSLDGLDTDPREVVKRLEGYLTGTRKAAARTGAKKKRRRTRKAA